MSDGNNQGLTPAVESLSLSGGYGVGVSRADARIKFSVLNAEATIDVSCLIRTDDNPTLAQIQERVLHGLQSGLPALDGNASKRPSS